MPNKNYLGYDGRNNPNFILKEEQQKHEFKCWNCCNRNPETDHCDVHNIDKVHTKAKLIFCRCATVGKYKKGEVKVRSMIGSNIAVTRRAPRKRRDITIINKLTGSLEVRERKSFDKRTTRDIQPRLISKQ